MTTYNLALTIGAASAISAAAITYPVTKTERIFAIEIDARPLAIGWDNRIFDIEQDNRVSDIEKDNRIYAVEQI